MGIFPMFYLPVGTVSQNNGIEIFLKYFYILSICIRHSSCPVQNTPKKKFYPDPQFKALSFGHCRNRQPRLTKQSTEWLNTSSIQVLLVFNDHPLLIIQASGITEEKIFQALHKQPSFSTGGLLWCQQSFENAGLTRRVISKVVLGKFG